MEGAQAIEAASSGINESTGIEAIKTAMKVMPWVIWVLVRLCVGVSAHVGKFETVVEGSVQLLQGNRRTLSRQPRAAMSE